jgi:hypothetical protein
MNPSLAKQRTWRQRCCQISLRTIVVVTTLVCLAAAVYGWRERRENELVVLVEKFNAAIDDGEFPKAVQIAERALDRFPNHPVAICMLEKGRLAWGISLGEPMPIVGNICY